jgi:excisionase family DNA binding protein
MELITISIPEAAKALGVSRSTTYEFINKGQLHAIKLGRRTLITVASIKQLVANAEVVGDMGWEKAA